MKVILSVFWVVGGHLQQVCPPLTPPADLAAAQPLDQGGPLPTCTCVGFSSVESLAAYLLISIFVKIHAPKSLSEADEPPLQSRPSSSQQRQTKWPLSLLSSWLNFPSSFHRLCLVVYKFHSLLPPSKLLPSLLSSSLQPFHPPSLGSG